MRFQDLCTLCCEYFSTFLHSTIRYRIREIFTVGSWCLPNSDPISNEPYSRYLYIFPQNTYGTVTLYSRTFQNTSISVTKIKNKSCNTTSLNSFKHRFSLPSAVFSRWYSQHLNWFLFHRVLRRFNSPGETSFRIVSKETRSRIQASPVQQLHAPRRSISSLATPFISSRTKSSIS